MAKHARLTIINSEEISLSRLNWERSIANSYWDNYLTRQLFMPSKNKSVTNCLVRRENIFGKTAYYDNVMISLVQDIDNVADLTNSQCQTIHTQCLYLGKKHELALQHLNTLT